MLDDAFVELFSRARTFAIVGYSDNPQRAGHFVPAYLAQQGYKIIAVNPKFAGEVDGFRCYSSLEEIPASEQVDVVDIFRAPEFAADVLADALAMSHKPIYFWMQPGAENPAVAAQADAAGLVTITRACALAEHKRLMAGGSK